MSGENEFDEQLDVVVIFGLRQSFFEKVDGWVMLGMSVLVTFGIVLFDLYR